jgi:hypothetical protein
MSEREKLIKLIEQFKEESVGYLLFLKCPPPGKPFSQQLQAHYNIRVAAFSEILGILKSEQPLEDFLERKGIKGEDDVQ